MPCFKSRYEAAWAKYLSEREIAWEYEPFEFRLDGGGVYVPDFLLRGYGPFGYLFIEVKGVRDADRLWKPAELSARHPTMLVVGPPPPDLDPPAEAFASIATFEALHPESAMRPYRLRGLGDGEDPQFPCRGGFSTDVSDTLIV